MLHFYESGEKVEDRIAGIGKREKGKGRRTDKGKHRSTENMIARAGREERKGRKNDNWKRQVEGGRK